MTKLYTEQDVAARFQLSVSTIQKWRVAGGGPAHIIIGTATVRYREQDLVDYENRCADTVAGARVFSPELEVLTDEQIKEVWRAMPGGPEGWLKSFGFIQFAHAIIDAARGPE